MNEVLNSLSALMVEIAKWLSPYIQEIALTAVASLLVIYGDTINGIIKKHIRNLHFVMRTLIFVLVCAFGYGMLTVFLAPLLASQLVLIPKHMLPVVILLVFIFIGILAERKKHL
ncbi:DUF3392 domain-containing protein [Flocculibacter collagenilyticus]|uniref:DUF3392 domain-containing protein n=1 Tax=Flocculibacter collagenilyticus TaxID=2744479 RepID=UPI001F33E166|nr:DUF3392 domain-containing protein [Flocculibacter collagenilyticus]